MSRPLALLLVVAACETAAPPPIAPVDPPPVPADAPPPPPPPPPDAPGARLNCSVNGPDHIAVVTEPGSDRGLLWRLTPEMVPERMVRFSMRSVGEVIELIFEGHEPDRHEPYRKPPLAKLSAGSSVIATVSVKDGKRYLVDKDIARAVGKRAKPPSRPLLCEDRP